MVKAWPRLVLAALFGLSAYYWRPYVELYASMATVSSSFYIGPFVVGVVAGALVVALSPKWPLMGWVAFIVTLFATKGAYAASTLGVPFEISATSFLRIPRDQAFTLGSLVIPAIQCALALRKKGSKDEPEEGS